MGGTGAPGGGLAMRVVTDSPWSGASAATYASADTLVRPGLGDDRAAVGVADQDDVAVQLVQDLPGRLDVAFQRLGRVFQPGVLRGRPLSAAATAARSPALPAEVGSLREVLAQESVGVLVAAALPGAVRAAEADVETGADAQLRVAGHLCALVPGERPP